MSGLTGIKKPGEMPVTTAKDMQRVTASAALVWSEIARLIRQARVGCAGFFKIRTNTRVEERLRNVGDFLVC
jgi:hypothetical protein